MNCPACQGDNDPEALSCVACGASLEASPFALSTGTPLHGGSYTVVNVLAQGGFGITYRCLDTRLGCEVAIKEFFPLGCARQGREVVPAGGWSRPWFLKERQGLLREGETLARFQHPGIVGVRAAFEENETVYIVMEFLRGRSLAQVLAEHGCPLDEAVAMDYVEKLAAGLAAVHEAGLLHRDLKPSNIVVTDDGRVVLIDFGAAREYAWGLSKSHSTVLTAGYAPLEQYSRRGVRGPFSDVYGLAATCWHLLTGQVPPDASDRAVGLEMPPLLTLRPGLSPGVAEAVERGLAMDPLLRPQSVEEFLGLWRGSRAPLVPSARSASQETPGGPPAADAATVDVDPPTFVVDSTPPGPTPPGPDPPGPTPPGPMPPGPTPPGPTPRVPEPPPDPPPGAEGSRRRPSLMLALAALALLVVAGALVLAPLRGGHSPAALPSPSIGSVTLNAKDGSVLLGVPGGAYPVGSTPTEMAAACEDAGRSGPSFEPRWLEAEAPAHTVRLAPYWIGKCEVTNAQFRRFVSATGFRAAGLWEEQARKWGENAPVVCVSWGDASAYCDWAGLRLPTEEEWEAAARGPSGSRFPWGNGWDASLCCHSVGKPRQGPEAVGRHPGGASWCGALDMAGNAWEWTGSWFEAYAGSTSSDNAFGRKYRVFRGGSWNNASPVYFRGSTRVRYAPADRFNDVGGFRCARSL